tara:strand:+ start:898 stop:1827 length:930 start_codon:yes stop_codon:yes gene_type:complete
MGLFGKKDDGSRFKSKKELKPMVKQARKEAKKSNAFKEMANILGKQTISTAKAGAKAGGGKSSMFNKAAIEGGSEAVSERKALLGDMPITDREKETLTTNFHTTGDPDVPAKKVMDADTKDMPIVTDEKEGAYMYSPGRKELKGDQDELPADLQKAILNSPAQKRMGNMVKKAQDAFSAKHSPATILNMGDDTLNTKAKPQVKAEMKKYKYNPPAPDETPSIDVRKKEIFYPGSDMISNLNPKNPLIVDGNFAADENYEKKSTGEKFIGQSTGKIGVDKKGIAYTTATEYGPDIPAGDTIHMKNIKSKN